MFPRPRKITRFLVFIFGILFIFSSYVYIFNSTAERVSSHGTNLGKMRANMHSFLLANQNSETADNQHASYAWDYTNDESAESVREFKGKVLDVFRKSTFFKERNQQQCLDEKLVTAERFENKSFSDLHVGPAPVTHVNPHNFAYIHNPSDMCTKRSVSFLIYIHSSPVNLKKRQAIRQTWGDLKLLSLFNATLVFILGATPNSLVQNIVNMEADKYGDIVQENFVDAYRNLTYKGMAALKWAANFCKCAAFVFKADDDILLDIVSVIDDLVTHTIPSHGANKLVLCNVWTRMRTMRNKKSKWYLSKEEFSLDTFPPYCSGSFFILSSDVIPLMYNMALNSKFFWVDDYFITGVLVNSLNIKHVNFNQVYLLNYNVVEEKLKHDRKEYLVFHIKQLNLFQRMWPLIVKRHKGKRHFLQNSSKLFSWNIFKSSHNNSRALQEASTDGTTKKIEDMTSSKPTLSVANTTQNIITRHPINRTRA